MKQTLSALVDSFLAQPVWQGRTMRAWFEKALPRVIDCEISIYDMEGTHMLRELAAKTRDPELTGGLRTRDLCNWQQMQYEQLLAKYEHAPVNRIGIALMNNIDRRKRGIDCIREDLTVWPKLLETLDRLKAGI